jgi:hypothetical protein
MSLGMPRIRSSQLGRVAKIVFLCVLALLLQIAIFSSLLFLRPTESIVPEITGMVFNGYLVGLAVLDFRLIFLFSPLVVYLAFNRCKRWAVFLLVSNYLFGLILYLTKHQGLDWSRVFTYQTVVLYLKLEAIAFHLIPLVLLHVIYYRALQANGSPITAKSPASNS